MKSKHPSTYTNFKQMSDLELFQLIGERNKEALETIFNRYYESLCRFGLTYEDKLDIVEEKVSDIFLQLWNNHENIRNIRNPKPYLYVVVKNKLLEPVKYMELEQPLNTVQGHQCMASPSIEEEIIYQEQKELYSKRIKEVLDHIPEKSRQIFEMSRLDGLKYREISEILGVSVKTVENHMGIALRTIRNIVIRNKQY
ncbi:sigma-70 family RNA polymerase sigma factor [Abyssalbus ytuae]|uniref:Sigma-70 family RNA polymerase sigma factor n=1 Tax=Abyssalbus ytuae TaxID=2926907 RepID=A0A9E7CYV8_9FLAO|nr:sigma-70 family RNA polymerase sigma factor [Abyssalbus ytuae]UOB17035.1 sigma-70 family RNA polymerase sigma factor [Abyssalbus ytuae]